jgi:PAS domain S-box-containing protein
MLGYADGELVGKFYWEMTHPDDVALTYEPADSLWNGTLSYLQVEKRYMHRAGHVVHAAISAVPLRDARGEPLYYISQVVDISERKLQAAQLAELADTLERRNRELEQYAYAASHDLKAPLLSLTGLASLLKEDYAALLPADGQRCLDRIIANGARLHDLLSELLAVSRAGRAEDVVEAVDLDALVRGVCAQFEDVRRRRGAEIQIDGRLPSVSANALRMGQVFQNLIDNALVYTAPEHAPRITISALERNDHWVVSVRDNGIGIATELRQRVFGMFQRLPDGKALNPSGSGIGLALVARIIEAGGGAVWIEPGHGDGTTVCFTILKDRTRPGASHATSALAPAAAA